jgi:hypothetical protein
MPLMKHYSQKIGPPTLLLMKCDAIFIDKLNIYKGHMDSAKNLRTTNIIFSLLGYERNYSRVMHAATKRKKMAFQMKYPLVKRSHDKNCGLNFPITNYVELLQGPFT